MNHARIFALLAVFSIFLISSVSAEIPQIINYQGILTNSAGEPVDTTVDIGFTICVDSAGTACIWAEEQADVDVSNGLFNVKLGTVVTLTETIFSDDNRWLHILIGGLEGEPIEPPTELISVPYAFRVSTVDGASGGIISGDVNIVSDGRAPGDLVVAGKATIGPGHTNEGAYTFIAGESNMTDPGGNYSVISGGQNNHAGGSYSVVGGGRSHIAHGDYPTIAGGEMNDVGDHSAVGGGYMNLADQYSVIAGGRDNSAVEYGAVAGGQSNILGDGSHNFIGGGQINTVLNCSWSTLAGGYSNDINNGSYSFLGGGYECFIDSNYCVVGGGYRNSVYDHYSTIAGGNYNYSNKSLSFIGGGYSNEVRGQGSVISGGFENTAEANWISIGGGNENYSEGYAATIAGGLQDTANGYYSMIPGGWLNKAEGSFSFAAGRRAKALHNGSFVWADRSDFDFSSTASNEFSARAVGGVRFVSAINGSGDPIAGVELIPGEGAWSTLSDRDCKENYKTVNTMELLDKLSALPVRIWNYKSQSEAIQHIGPTAQDFYAAFGVGADSLRITTVDADGVALAAVKALLEKIEKMEKRIQELESGKVQ